jgi:hypothetical protein
VTLKGDGDYHFTETEFWRVLESAMIASEAQIAICTTLDKTCRHMATFRDQKDLAEDLRLRQGATRRINCHLCGCANELAANRFWGELFWYCCRASCPSEGRIDTDMTLDTIR